MIKYGLPPDATALITSGLWGVGHHQGAAESNCPTGNCPVFKITDGTNTMMAITDRGDIGDLCAPGHAAQPGGAGIGRAPTLAAVRPNR